MGLPDIAMVYLPEDRQKCLKEAASEWLILYDHNSTGKTYRKDMSLFLEYLEGHGFEDIKVHEVGSQHLSSFQIHEINRGISVNTIRRRIYGLRSFFSWASTEKGYTAKNPVKEMRLPSKKRSFPDVLTVEEVHMIIDATDLRKNMGIRDRAMISLCYYTGLRISELCSLKTNSMRKAQFTNKQKERISIVVDGKGGKVRSVPLNSDAKEDLERWLSIKPDVETDALFVQLRNGKPMTVYAFRKLFNKHLKISGVDLNNRKISPHTLRHSFATHLAQGKERLEVIRDLLGHAHLQTTEIYSHIAKEEYAAAVDSLTDTRRSRKLNIWD